MKKRILYGIPVFAIVAIAISNVVINSNKEFFSDTSLANVEALAQELDPNKYTPMSLTCYNKYGNVTGTSTSCIKPGVASSCTAKSCGN